MYSSAALKYQADLNDPLNDESSFLEVLYSAAPLIKKLEGAQQVDRLG